MVRKMGVQVTRGIAARLLVVGLGIILWLAASAAAPALAAQQGSTGFNLEGKITDVSTGKLTVSTQDNIIFHVTYGKQTKIYRKDGSTGTPSDLTVGARIRVSGELSPAGAIRARRINIE